MAIDFIFRLPTSHDADKFMRARFFSQRRADAMNDSNFITPSFKPSYGSWFESRSPCRRFIWWLRTSIPEIMINSTLGD